MRARSQAAKARKRILRFKNMRLLLILASIALSASAQSRLTIAGRDVTVWKPAGAAPASGFPLVVFSHGYTGCATQSKFLTEALARSGYLVVAPNHRDALCGGTVGHSFTAPQESFVKDRAWSDATYRDRAADIRAVLDAVLGAKSFEGVPVDPSRIALAGHSLGGYTVLGVAGAWPSWKDPRVKAVLALSPYCEPYVRKGDLAHLNVPVMYQGGTLDIGITPTVRHPGGAYDLSGAPKYYVELKGAGHLAWTDLNRKYQAIIAQYSVAFFDEYLKANHAALPPLIKKPYPRLISFLRADSK